MRNCVRFAVLTTLLATLLLPALASAAKPVELTFWNMPFVTQEVSPEYVAQWEKDVKVALPDVKVDNFYGPGDYGPQREKYLLQAKSGKPDVVEGLLEDMAVYVQKGLISPLDDRFAAWEDSKVFVPSTLTPLHHQRQALWHPLQHQCPCDGLPQGHL